MIGNLFYFAYINSIGGVETFFYNIARKYKDLDIVIVYKDGNDAQIRRLSKLVRVKRFNGERFSCRKAFFNYNLDIIDSVDAEEYYQILHADYSVVGITPIVHPRIDHYLGVSQVVCDSWEKLTGIHADLAYNPILKPGGPRALNLISATRLTKEKGKARMEAFAKALDSAGIPYQWTVFTNDGNRINNENIIYRKQRLDIESFIQSADYLVQLSDGEGYCFSVVEALMLHTPVIVTKCPVFEELGIKNGVHGFLLDFDMKNIPLKEIARGISGWNFSWDPPKDTWKDILAPEKSRYEEDLNSEVAFVAAMRYYDLELNREVKSGEVFLTNSVRAEYLKEKGIGSPVYYSVDIVSV